MDMDKNDNNRKLTPEELKDIIPKSMRKMDYSKMKTRKSGELRHDKDIVLSDIIQKLYKDLWTPTGVIAYLSDYHAISETRSRQLMNEAKSMFYEHLRNTKSDIFLDCYNMMMVVAQKGMENEDYKLVLDSTKEIAKLHHLYSDDNSQQEHTEQPLFSPPQKYEGISKEDLYIDTDYENVNEDVDNDNEDKNNK